MKYLLLFCLLKITNLGFAQNLVPDSSFEEKLYCPKSVNFSPLKRLTRFWMAPTFATPDYYHHCGIGEGSVPKNLLGIQNPSSGDAYAGLLVLAESAGYREYLEVELQKPLEKNTLYCLKLFASQPTYIYYSTNKLGALFTRRRQIRFNEAIIRRRDYQNFDSSEVLGVSKDWTCLSLIYKAKGGERFLTLGSFNSDQSTTVNINALPSKFKSRYLKNKGSSYFYIDDVSLWQLEKGLDCGCSSASDSLDKNVQKHPSSKGISQDTTERFFDTLILGDLTFQTASWKLEKNAIGQLEELAKNLVSDTLIHMLVEGHTDDDGTEKYNMELSEQRAKSVADYLVVKGISMNRISYIGKGNSHPISDNTTDFGRAKNRRVELKFFRKNP